LTQEVNNQREIICQLHDFLRAHLPKFLMEEEFNYYLFYHLCSQIYSHGFSSQRKKVSQMVIKLLKFDEEGEEMKRLWTLLRFCSFGCFGHGHKLSMNKAPDLFPYQTKLNNEEGLQLFLEFHPDQTFSVRQVRSFAFSTKKNTASQEESENWAKIHMHWTISEPNPPNRPQAERQPRRAFLEFPHAEFNSQTSNEIINYVLNALRGAGENGNEHTTKVGKM
jgi:hypothetical protein